MKILFWLSVFACFFSIGLLPAELQLWSIEKRSTILPHARFLLASHYCHQHHHLLRNSISKGLTSEILFVDNHTTIHSKHDFLKIGIKDTKSNHGSNSFWNFEGTQGEKSKGKFSNIPQAWLRSRLLAFIYK